MILPQQPVALPDFIESLVAIIELRDAYTKGHSKRVAQFAQALAEAAGLDPHLCGDLYLAGLVHDIGKIGIPDAVLLKPGKLTPDEYETIKYHSLLSAMIIEPIESLRAVVPLVRHHHERIDGRGYPDGLKGEEIPLGARILAIADVYDALTSSRVYRTGMSHEKAKEVMRQMVAEGHLDREWTALFLDRVTSFTVTDEPPLLTLKPLEVARTSFFYRDPLTKLLNRDALLALVKQGLSKGVPIILYGLDIAGFKGINLRFGLAHGDKLLTQIGAHLAPYARLEEQLTIDPEEIKAFRTFADHFYLLYCGLAADYFDFKVNQLRTRIEAQTSVTLKVKTILHASQERLASIEWGALL
jgi:GGDEF domain-containing protein